MKKNELLELTSKEIIALMRQEIEEINNMKTEPVEEVYIEDKDTKKREKVLVRSTDLIKKAFIEKKQVNLVSDCYLFETLNILPYSEANDYRLNGKRLEVKHSLKYNEYSSEIKNWFNDKNKDNMLEFFLKQEKIMIIIKIKLVNIKKDIDNVVKPFVDCLFFNISGNDNKIKRLLSSVEKSYTGKDSIELQIITLRDEDWEKGVFFITKDVKKEFHYESIF